MNIYTYKNSISIKDWLDLIFYKIKLNKLKKELSNAIFNDDMEFVARKFGENPELYSQIYIRLDDVCKNNKKVALAAVKSDPRNYGFLPNELKVDGEILNSIRGFLSKFCINEPFLIFLGTGAGRGLEWIHQAKENLLKYDAAFMDRTQGIEVNMNMDMSIQPDVRKVIFDPKVEFPDTPNYFYKNYGDEFGNKEHVLKNLTTWHKNIYSISNELKSDKDVVLAFIENCVVWFNPSSGDVFDCNANYFNEYDLYNFLAEISEDLRRDKDVLNALRRFLLNDDYASIGLDCEGLFMKARDTLLANDREDELLSKLSNLDKGEDKARKKI